MGYRVDRVGTPHMCKFVTPISQTIDTTWISSRIYNKNSVKKYPVSVEGSTYDKFGSVFASYGGSGTLPSGKAIAFGQNVRMVDVLVGNASLIECVASFEGQISQSVAINHRIGYVENPGATSALGTVYGGSLILEHQPALALDAATTWRNFQSKAVFMSVETEAIAQSIVEHFVELVDTETGTNATIGDINISLTIRTVDTAGALFPYDPTR